jgi:hypothetical protein
MELRGAAREAEKQNRIMTALRLSVWLYFEFINAFLDC